METCKSPRKVMRAAYALALDALPEYSSQFSRKDFTLPQLFACLAIREHQKKSYRGTEALLIDSPDWPADCGMTKAPDHNGKASPSRHALPRVRRDRHAPPHQQDAGPDGRVVRRGR